MVLVTSLIDHKQYNEVELTSLYHQRWDIEIKLRDLKTTLGMECFEVKSPEMAHKTLWMSVIAFNLMRSLMQKAAGNIGKPVWHISFKGVLDLVCASHESIRCCAGMPRKKATAMAQFIDICSTSSSMLAHLGRNLEQENEDQKATSFYQNHATNLKKSHIVNDTERMLNHVPFLPGIQLVLS